MVRRVVEIGGSARRAAGRRVAGGSVRWERRRVGDDGAAGCGNWRFGATGTAARRVAGGSARGQRRGSARRGNGAARRFGTMGTAARRFGTMGTAARRVAGGSARGQRRGSVRRAAGRRVAGGSVRWERRVVRHDGDGGAGITVRRETDARCRRSPNSGRGTGGSNPGRSHSPLCMRNIPSPQCSFQSDRSDRRSRRTAVW